MPINTLADGSVNLLLLCLNSQILGYQNTVFFGGDCISMIDYLFWPWFERLDVYGIAE